MKIRTRNVRSNPRKRTKPRKGIPVLARDPTRMLFMRRAFAAKVKAKFARLRLAIVELVAKEDAFGLRDRQPNPVRITNADGENCGTGAGGFQPGNTCGKGRGPLPDEVKDNIEQRGLSGPLAGIRKQVLVSRGVSEEAIEQMDRLFDHHRWGESHQAEADAEIAAAYRADTPLGHALRTQVELEDSILDYYERSLPAIVDRNREKSKRDMKDLWEMGAGNKDAYDSWEEEWRDRDEYKFKNEPMLFYRKGGLDKDVLPTSTNSTGAQSAKVIGTAAQPHFVPTNKWTSAQMRAAGYRVLGGLGYIQMGYPGEGEVTWIRVGKRTDNRLTANDRWRFRQSDEKVKEFQAWLREQMGKEVVGKSDEALWKAYVQAGYRKGAGRAFDDVRKGRTKDGKQRTGKAKLDFYDGTRDEFLRSAFGRPESVAKVKLLAGRAFDDLRNVTEDMSARMSRTLADGLVQGKHPTEIAEDLVEDVGLGEARAQMIARTEIIRAHNEAQLDSFEALGVEDIGVAVEWEVTEDEKLCPLCEAMRGVVLTVEEARGKLPAHPNCLPGDSLVLSRSGIAAASKRWFDGDLIVIRVAGGDVLSCTPNHPVLAAGGLWTPARLLVPGDHVVCDGGREWRGARHHDGEDVPTCIHEIAESRRRAGKVLAAKVPVSAPDFHGDGGGSDVAHVWADGELWDERQAALGEHLPQDDLVLRRQRKVAVPGCSPGAQLLERSLAPPASCVRCGYLVGPLLGAHGGPLNGLGRALVSQGDAGALQPVVDGPAADAEPFGQRVGTFSREVSGDHLRYWELPVHVDAAVVGVPQNARDDLVRDAVLGRKLASGGACEVFLDQVVSVDRVVFHGHVYNLETGDGWYAANGIITHNCRCAFLPANVGEKPEGQMRSRAGIEAAAEEAGIEFSVGRERPVSIFNAYCPTVNPFVSEEQRRACHAKDDPAWDCEEWEEETEEEKTK